MHSSIHPFTEIVDWEHLQCAQQSDEDTVVNRRVLDLARDKLSRVPRLNVLFLLLFKGMERKSRIS